LYDPPLRLIPSEIHALEAEIPISPRSDIAVAEHERMTGLELVDAREHRPWTRHELVADVVVDRLSIDGALESRMLEKSLDLRCEDEPAGLPRIVERLDAEAIARHEELTAGRVPHREGEHAGQTLDARLAPL